MSDPSRVVETVGPIYRKPTATNGLPRCYDNGRKEEAGDYGECPWHDLEPLFEDCTPVCHDNITQQRNSR
jgi:hypothetical protein